MSERAYWVWVFLTGLVFGAFLTGSFYVYSNWDRIFVSPAPVIPPTEDSTLVLPREDASGTVVVHDQKAGESVLVSLVAVAPPGVWVVVHEIGKSDIANALGAARVRTATEAVTVNLLRATTPGARYAVVLYRDNDDEAFTLDADSVYVDYDTGKRVVATFETY